MVIRLLKKDQNFNFVFMIFNRDHNNRFIILFILFSLPLSLFSQEETEIDTSDYMIQGYNRDANFYGTRYSKTEILNYNLMIAASKGYASEIHRLIKRGAEPDASSVEKVTPLMFAVVNSKIEAVNALLSYHVDVNTMTVFSETPLLSAAKNDDLDIAEALIRDSADVNLSDKFGAAPLHYAAIYGYLDMTDLLLYYDAQTYKKTSDGTTPLMAAVWSGHPDVADLLIQNGANPEERDNMGFTPFLIAAQNGDTISMEILIKRRVNIYEVNQYNFNALDIAIKSNLKDAVAYLLRKGDKWTANGNNSINPYLLAAKYNRKEIEQLLEKNQMTKSYRLGFDQVSISASFKCCFHDYFLGFGLSFKEPSINAGIFAGCDVKPGYTRVLIKKAESLFYQYKDRSSMAYIGLFKDIRLTDNPYKANWFISGSVAAAYTFGNKLKGTEITPPNKFKVIPGISLKWSSKNLNFYGSLEFLQSEYYKVGPVWLRLGASYSIFFDKIRAPGKDIKWY